MEVEREDEVEMENGAFKDFLYVPNHTSNFLLVYQITHYGSGNKLEFLLDLVVLISIKDDSMVAIGEANHYLRL